MSPNLLQAAFELGRDCDFPLMFIASRNQVDLDELGGGYVNSWDQKRFSEDIAEAAQKVGFDGLYYLCRDHGGPWQRDEERNAHLPEDEAMELAKKSYLADMLNGFDLLMIDPTKDPFEIGKVIPLDVVLRRTVDLIEWCEKERVILVGRGQATICFLGTNLIANLGKTTSNTLLLAPFNQINRTPKNNIQWNDLANLKRVLSWINHQEVKAVKHICQV